MIWIICIIVAVLALIFWPREPKAKKCERLGHVDERQTRGGMRKSTSADFMPGVAVRFREERHVCACCGIQLSEPKEISARGTDSWSAPQSIWDEFNDKGRWLDSHWAA